MKRIQFNGVEYSVTFKYDRRTSKTNHLYVLRFMIWAFQIVYICLHFLFEDFYKNHLNEYSIQVGLYALILKEWGFDIRGGYLVHIGPDDEAKLYPCVDMVTILEKYLEYYVWN